MKALVQLTKIHGVGLSGEEGGQLVVVQDVVGLVAGHPLLEQPKAVAVDGAHVESAETVEHGLPRALLDPPGDSVTQFLPGPLGEGEGDDPFGRHAVGQQIGNPLGDDFCLSRPSGSDDLQVATSVLNS